MSARSSRCGVRPCGQESNRRAAPAVPLILHIIWKKGAWLKVRKFDPAARNGKCPLYLTRINLKTPRRPFSLPPSIFDSCLFLLAREGIITAVATCELEVNYGCLAPREPRTLTVTNEYAEDPVRRSHCSNAFAAVLSPQKTLDEEEFYAIFLTHENSLR